MDRRLAFSVLGAVVLVVVGIGAYAWYSRSDNTGSAQSTIDLINNKLAQNGQPTLPPDTVPFSPRITPSGATLSPQRPAAANTAIPATTLAQLGCGAGGITGIEEIVAAYGPLNSACALYGNFLLFTTQGSASAHGGIGLFECGPTDTSCRQGGLPEHPGAWSFYPGPKVGGIKIFFYHPDTQEFIIDSGGLQTCFKLATRTYC